MSVFVDTSAILAGLDKADQQHEAARATWTDLLQGDEPLLTTNYVIIETMALLQHRGGLSVVRRFLGEFFPALQVHWIIEPSIPPQWVCSSPRTDEKSASSTARASW